MSNQTLSDEEFLKMIPNEPRFVYMPTGEELTRTCSCGKICHITVRFNKVCFECDVCMVIVLEPLSDDWLPSGCRTEDIEVLYMPIKPPLL